MISSNAVIVTDAPSLFSPFIPLTGESNTGSVRSYVNGSGDDGIFGTASYSSTLDTNSITVEFWMRTTENDAGFVARTTSSSEAGEGGTLSSGFRIVDPNNVRVNFWTSTLAGGSTTSVTLTSGVSVNDGNWHYIAFRFNSATGDADLWLDGGVVATYDGPSNRRLWYGSGSPSPQVIIGYRMDGNPANTTGTLDEIRFSNVYLPDEELLIVPEPSVIVGAIFLLLGVVWHERCRLFHIARGNFSTT